MADYRASPWVAEPLRVLDCCLETDGGQAIVVTTAERARHLAQRPVAVSCAAQGAWAGQDSMTNFYTGDMDELPEMRMLAAALWRQTGLGPRDISATILYDHFTPFVLMQLEAFEFCPQVARRPSSHPGHLIRTVSCRPTCTAASRARATCTG